MKISVLRQSDFFQIRTRSLHKWNWCILHETSFYSQKEKTEFTVKVQLNLFEVQLAKS